MLEVLLGLGGGPYIPFELLPHLNIYWTNDYVQRLLNVRDWSWSDAMGNTFHFTNRNNGQETGTRVWRSETPFDKDNLPSEPLMVLPPGATSFTDNDAPRGSRYYYMLEVFKGSNNSEFTVLFEAYALGINVGPGPQELIAGTPGIGFYGEVPVSELINGTDLATQIDLTAGTAQNSDEPWLKFNLDGKTLFVAKRPYRNYVSWDQINTANAVYGSRIITIRDEQYRVRLLKGAASDPITGGSNQHDPEQSWGSEWNRLLYPLVPNPTSTPTRPVSREGIQYGEWGDYTEADLGITSGNGRLTWCQESSGNERVVRGSAGLSYFHLNSLTAANSQFGWRPVLELIN